MMIASNFRVMALGLLRDRGAFAMAFLLPPLIYIIFAAIFASATGDDLLVRVAVLDEVKNPASQRLTQALRVDPKFQVVAGEPASLADLERMVRRDQADVGIRLLADPSESAAKSGQSPIVVYGDPGKAMAAAMAAGHVQRIFGERLPDAAYRRVLADVEKNIAPFTPQQRTRADGILEFIQRSTEPGAKASLKDAVSQRAMPPLVATVMAGTSDRPRAAVVYYAGAVAILFLMYGAMHGAMSLIDERRSGIADRILQSASGMGPVLVGKFLFLVLKGAAQASLIFAVAQIVYGVDVAHRLPLWTLVTLGAAATAAALGLALAALARSRPQAETASTFIVLVLAALGGSMIPRFLMPAWLQQVSWAIPNAWVIEAYHGLLWHDYEFSDLFPTLLSMACFTVAMLLVARIALRSTALVRA